MVNMILMAYKAKEELNISTHYALLIKKRKINKEKEAKSSITDIPK